MTHKNNFGAIRLLLAILVVEQHACLLCDGNLHREPWLRLTGTFGLGSVAVLGFFLLSGYLITQSWCREPQLGGYLRNRILRIYPGFLVAACFTIYAVGWLGADTPGFFHQISQKQIIKSLLALQIPGRFPSFGGFAVPGLLNGSLWTVPAEFACYLMVAAAGCTRLLARRSVWPLLLLIGVAIQTLDARLVASQYLREPYASLAGEFLSVVPYFLAGMCFYQFRDRIRYTPRGAAIAGALVLFCAFNDFMAPAGYAIAGGYLLFALAFAKIPSLRPVGQRTDLSYGIYLYHWPCQRLLLLWLHGLHPAALFLLSLTCAAALAYVSWKLIEAPALRLKRSADVASPVKLTAPQCPTTSP